MNQSTGVMFFDHELGRHRVALFLHDATTLRDRLSAWAGCAGASQYAKLDDQGRSAAWSLYMSKRAAVLELEEVDTDVPVGNSVFCSTCLRLDCLPLFAGYGDYGEPLVFCERCSGILLMARAAVATGISNRAERACSYVSVLAE